MLRLILDLMQFSAHAKFHERTPAVLVVTQRTQLIRGAGAVHSNRVKDCVDGSMVRAFNLRDTAVMQTLPGQI
jgi:hypothetical protein